MNNNLIKYAKSIIEEAQEIETQQNNIDYSKSNANEINRSLSNKFNKIKNLIEPAKKYLEYIEIYETIINNKLDHNEELKTEFQKLVEDSYSKFNNAVQQQSVQAYLGDALLEFKVGVGGDESALFNLELWEMYQRYAYYKGWIWQVLDFNTTADGKGLKSGEVKVLGDNAYARLRLEAGIHRVQRVPQTESMGRLHTSAIAICVFQIEEEIEIEIKPSDIEITTKKGSGPGGQSVNTTDSAVVIKHLATGIVVNQQDERSQNKNKEKALKILKERLLLLSQKTQFEKKNSIARQQFATGDRSDKIRTYHFGRQQVTDHRSNVTTYQLNEALKGEAIFDAFLGQIIVKHDSDQR